MANSRAYLVCTDCLRTEVPCWLYIGKYYPSSGWGFTLDAVQDFADAHAHGTADGTELVLHLTPGWLEGASAERLKTDLLVDLLPP